MSGRCDLRGLKAPLGTKITRLRYVGYGWVTDAFAVI